MKRIASVLLTVLLLIPCISLAEGEDASAAPRAFVEMLYRGEFQQVFDQSTPDVQAALGSADSFAGIWTQLAQAYGAYDGILSATVAEQGGFLVAQITCAYEYADITYIVTLDADGLLAGLNVADVKPHVTESTADTSLFVTKPVTLRPGETDETQGMLTFPNGDGPFPAVIMMQGSGATDMNESAYGITPFRDLAEGLAQAGVASIRYDKYSYAHADMLRADPALLASFTIRDEYVLDAQAALDLLRADERIGAIYLLGHSEGAMLIPRIMQALGAEHFAGGVMLAGSPLPLWEIQYHQNLAMIQDAAKDKREALLTELDAKKEKLTQLLTMTDAELQQTMFFGISAYYQMDLLSVDTAQTAIALQKPLLIVQGGKDWQVTPADGIEAWQAALQGQLDVDYLLYPDMNHMLYDMEGEPAGNTSDYQAGSAASQTLIGDIAAWILGM